MQKVNPPRSVRIGRCEAASLYEAEEKLRASIRSVARERCAAVNGDWSDESFYATWLPQTLFDLLDCYSPRVGRVVCETWLEHNPGDFDPTKPWAP